MPVRPSDSAAMTDDHGQRHAVRDEGEHDCPQGGPQDVGPREGGEGMCDMSESALGCQARNDLPIGIEDWPPELDHPGWAAAAGLSMYSAKLKVQGELERQSVGLLARILR